MLLYNATQTSNATPRAGMLRNDLLWPDGPRDHVPQDDTIRSVIKAAGDCAFLFVDDSEQLSDAGTAELCYRAAAISKKPVNIYGPPGSAGYARNLVQPWNFHIADPVFGRAKQIATVPVWAPPGKRSVKKPLTAFVDAICPSLFLGKLIGQYTDLDPFTAWNLVAEAALHAARIAAQGKPIIPFLWLEPDLGVIPEQLIDRLTVWGIEAAAIWDGPGGTSAMNVLLG